MMYFWLIPVVAIVLLALWLLYSATAKQRRGGRTDGRTLSSSGADGNREGGI